MLGRIKELKLKAKTKEDRDLVKKEIEKYQQKLVGVFNTLDEDRKKKLKEGIQAELTDILVDIENAENYERLLAEKEKKKKTCGEPCEVYSRVTGYYSPISQRNKGKLSEFTLRKTMNINKSLEHNIKKDEH